MKLVSVFSVVAAAALLGVTLAGCPKTTTPPTPPPPETEQPAIVPATSPQGDIPGDKPAPAGRKITVYSVEEDKEGNQSLKSKEVPLSDGDAQTPAAFALKTLIEEPNSPLPKGTTLNGVKIENGVATVDFSKELKDNFPGGDTAEALLINAVCSTLGQFKSVKSVQFLVDGKKIDSLGGNQTLDEPLPVPQASATEEPTGTESASGGGA